MKLYGRSRDIGFHGVVLDDQDKVVRECNHLHLTRSSAETCGKTMAKKVRKERDGQAQAS